MAPEGVKCYNPAFDVTDNSLITGKLLKRVYAEHHIQRVLRSFLCRRERPRCRSLNTFTEELYV
jgi:hypothetical protein